MTTPRIQDPKRGIRQHVFATHPFQIRFQSYLVRVRLRFDFLSEEGRVERGLRGNRIRLHGLKGGGMEDGGCCLLLPREIKGIPAEKRRGKGGREKEDLELASPKKKEERRADVPPPPSIHPRSYPPIPLNAIYIQNPLTWLSERRRRIFFFW